MDVCDLKRDSHRSDMQGRARLWFLLLLLTCGGAASAAEDNIVTGKTRNGCSYDIELPPWNNSKEARKKAKESFSRQTWDGQCVNGRLHGEGTLHDYGVKFQSVSDDYTTKQHLVFIHGRRLRGPYSTDNLDHIRMFDGSLRYRNLEFGFGEVATSPDRIDYLLMNTLVDGGINPVSSVDSGSDAKLTDLLGGIAALADGGITKDPSPAIFYANGRTDGYRSSVELDSDGILCDRQAACLGIWTSEFAKTGEPIPDTSKVYCSDCRLEWVEASASALLQLSGYLEQHMPQFEATAQANGIDISGVKQLVAPFARDRVEARIAQARRQLAQQKAAAKAKRETEAAAARKRAISSANQARRPVASPSFDALIKQAMGGKR